MELELKKHGFEICFGGTDNHMVLVDVWGSKGVSGKEAQEALDEIGISLNMNMIPNDSRKPMDPSGIRIGVPAITTRGMKEKEIKKISRWITDAIENKDNKKVLKKIHQEVIKLCKKFPIYKNM
jgi:glycine hydroxymethyltransferase